MNHEMCAEDGIGNRLRDVRSRIEAACVRSGRAPQSVTLIAVSKKKPVSDIEEARASGVIHFGENYVQELTQKMDLLEHGGAPGAVQWHMIGHLQKNKVKYLVGRTALIHSVDSVALAEQIDREAARRELLVRILLEVNIAGEESKWGFAPAEVFPAARQLRALSHIRTLGLMTSAPFTEEPDSNRPWFRELNACAQALSKEGLLYVSDPVFPGPVLSMGMTGDYEVAVEEGATMVRVGTGIFGERQT